MIRLSIAARLIAELDADYDRIGAFFGGLADAHIGGSRCFIDKTGGIVLSLDGYDACGGCFRDGLTCVGADGVFSFIDCKGNIVIPHASDNMSWFSEGLAHVVRKGKYGFIDTSGDTVIPFIYDNTGSFSGL